ncbi:hypothetical protein CR513_12312, partial [Mucuna pruriens]
MKNVGRSQRKMGGGTPPSAMVISYYTLVYHPRNPFPINIQHRDGDPSRNQGTIPPNRFVPKHPEQRRNASEPRPTAGGTRKNLQEHQRQQAHPKLGRTLQNHGGNRKGAYKLEHLDGWKIPHTWNMASLCFYYS